jgi:hypothetical protein
VQGLSARCGTLQVPEDRLSGTGSTISIRFVVFPARGPRRAPDPVVDAIRLDDARLAAGVHQLLLSADTATYVPLVIHSMYAANGQPTATAAVIRRLTAAGLLEVSGSQSVIAYPIRCAEPWARYQPGQISDAAKRSGSPMPPPKRRSRRVSPRS